MDTYRVLGVMTGTSMDGLDLAYCQFNNDNGAWSYEVLATAFIPHPKKWRLRLKNLVLQNAVTYIKTHTFFGHYLGGVINEFIDENGIRDGIDYIASHGQTVFHQPENRMTSQIGDGAAIAAITAVPVICNFRTTDVALGGQGAPIVPIGDLHLYADHLFCLNIGGIANISCKLGENKMIGYDICGANLILNSLSEKLGFEYDEDGRLAREGRIDENLLDALNNSWYFEKDYPKTLGGGWVRKVMMPIFNRAPISIEDQIATATEHIAMQIAKNIELIYDREVVARNEGDKMLVTGGGAFNKYLMERIQDLSSVKVILPDVDTVVFKEAIIIGFIGVLRVRGEVNCLSSVTGAARDNVGGEIYF